MPSRQRILAGLLIVAVLLLAVFAMWIILLRLQGDEFLAEQGRQAPEEWRFAGMITSELPLHEATA